MNTDKKDKNKLNDKLKHTYRFIIRNDEDLKEVNSFKLSLSRIYMLIIAVFILLSIMIISMIAFTPIKRLIPGYGDINNNAVFVQLNSEFNDLEKMLEEQITYTESLKKIIFKKQPITNTIDIEDGHNHGRTVSTISTISSLNDNPGKIPYLLPPVKGDLSMGYLLKKDHFGIDLVCSKNSEVKAITDGVVLNAVWDPKTGNNISIQHKNNLVSIYKHNATLLKKIGEQVSAGEAIAIVGNSGEQSTGPHLHFELWSNGQPVNPELFINFN